MGDRGMIHFKQYGRVEAAIYTHSCGSAVDAEMAQFFEYIERLWPRDTRYDDASYLAARFVVYAGTSTDGLGIGIIRPGSAEGPIWEVDCDTLDEKGRPSITRQNGA